MRYSAMAAGAVAVLCAALFQYTGNDSSSACPDGYRLKDTLDYAREFQPNMSAQRAAELVEQYGAQICLNGKHPEPMAELLAVNAALTTGVGPVAPVAPAHAERPVGGDRGRHDRAGHEVVVV